MQHGTHPTVAPAYPAVYTVAPIPQTNLPSDPNLAVQQPVQMVGAMEVIKIIGSRFLDLKCLSRLPGLKPGAAEIVDGILALALTWADPVGFIEEVEKGNAPPIDIFNLDPCWQMAQDHRSYWEEVFRIVSLTPSSAVR
jgi:hypothetical protein